MGPSLFYVLLKCLMGLRSTVKSEVSQERLSRDLGLGNSSFQGLFLCIVGCLGESLALPTRWR